MKRNQTFHETLIPMLVEGIGAQSYLEFGTYDNSTIRKVRCERRYGVDTKPVYEPGLHMFQMTTQEFIAFEAAKYAPFDVCFIDADHNAEAVLRDFLGIIPYMVAEGLILAHDCNPETVADTAEGYCGDGWKAAQHIVEGGWEAMVLPYHPGLLIARKRNDWGPK